MDFQCVMKYNMSSITRMKAHFFLWLFLSGEKSTLVQVQLRQKYCELKVLLGGGGGGGGGRTHDLQIMASTFHVNKMTVLTTEPSASVIHEIECAY